MYCSAASWTTQAGKTLFRNAIFSKVGYISGGKLIDARTDARSSSLIWLSFGFLLAFIE